jgi:metal-responsive CopG/Arc/MetJ family transcriptional regulator
MWSILWSWIDDMETVHIVLDKELLRAADKAVRRTKQNRSALVRDALREHLRKLEERASEERHREGYSKQPQQRDEANAREPEAAWPARVPCE